MVTGERRMVHDWASGINNWYQFDASGKMVTGWYLDSDNVWYYYGADGKAVSGITTIGSATYYLASDGRMCTNYSVSIGGIMYYLGRWCAFQYAGSAIKWLEENDRWLVLF